jgi:hypothetical protein
MISSVNFDASGGLFFFPEMIPAAGKTVVFSPGVEMNRALLPFSEGGLSFKIFTFFSINI